MNPKWLKILFEFQPKSKAKIPPIERLSTSAPVESVKERAVREERVNLLFAHLILAAFMAIILVVFVSTNGPQILANALVSIYNPESRIKRTP